MPSNIFESRWEDLVLGQISTVLSPCQALRCGANVLGGRLLDHA